MTQHKLEKRAVLYYRLFSIFTGIGEILSLPAQLFWNIGSFFKRRSERFTLEFYEATACPKIEMDLKFKADALNKDLS